MNVTSPEFLSTIAGPIADTVGSVVAPFMQWISVGIGGLFGLYTIYFIIKILIDKHRLSVLNEVKAEVDSLRQQMPSKDDIRKLTALLEKDARLKSNNKKITKTKSTKTKKRK
ncbi:hypothetical protein HOC01_01355 [archaeon]|jgi:hypothetical protein|nr:hypothetical protein [archaeon]MBT6698033.1 hypothetical protein [archaeon]